MLTRFGIWSQTSFSQQSECILLSMAHLQRLNLGQPSLCAYSLLLLFGPCIPFSLSSIICMLSAPLISVDRLFRARIVFRKKGFEHIPS